MDNDDKSLTEYSRRPHITNDSKRPRLGETLSDAFLPREAALLRQAYRLNESVLPREWHAFLDVVSGGHFGKKNAILSGGSQIVRFCAEQLLVERALSKGVAVVILHCGNPYFRQYGNPVQLPGKQSGTFAPLASTTPMEAAEILTKIGISAMNLPNLMGFWKLVTEISALADGVVSLSRLIDLPLFHIQDYLVSSKIIPSDRKTEFINLYDRVADMVDDAQLLLSELQDLPQSDPGGISYSLADIVDVGGMVCIDIVSDSNAVYKELCFAELERLMRRGRRFVLLLENIGLTGGNTSYADRMLLHNSGEVTLLYGSDDAHVAVKANQELFQCLVGGSNSAVVLRHNNAGSAKQWEAYFGQYYHLETDISASNAKETFALFNRTNTSGVTARRELRSLIPARMITELNDGQAIIKTADGKLWFSVL